LNLRQLAAADNVAILENEETGFGWPLTVTDPDGVSRPFTGMSGDISQIIDPETGVTVSGRLATVTISLQSIALAGMGVPKGIADIGRIPWVVQFDDIAGTPHRFKVSESDPDRTLGYVTLILEFYPV
jgi:hypothetical protein